MRGYINSSSISQFVIEFTEGIGKTSGASRGYRRGRTSLLHLISLYLVENGAELALKPCWKSAQKFTPTQGRRFHTIILTPPL